MNRKRLSYIPIPAILFLLVCLALPPSGAPANATPGTGSFALSAQAGGHGGQNGAPASSAPATDPTGQISYQGRLLQNGVPYNGDINITFGLYSTDSGGSAWWSETQLVHVSGGLFNVMLGAVSPLSGGSVTYFDAQAWLGIQPAGAGSELTPRQLLGAAPYAMGLVPGATMYDHSTGGYMASFWVASDDHVAVYANSGSQDAIESGASADQKSAVNANASGDDGHALRGTYSGDSTSCLYGAGECASSLYARTTGDAYGVYINSTQRSGIIITGTSTFWDIYDENSHGTAGNGINTAGKLTVGGYATFAGGKSGYVVDIALNDGNVPLERGDVVVISGYADPVVGEVPVPRVMLPSEANATAVIGVVDALWLPCTKTNLQAGEACGGFEQDVAVIQPGQYLSVVTLGAYKAIKVDASGGPIKPGDILAASATDGYAMKATQLSLDGVKFYAPGTIVGKALAALDSGTGLIPVFVSAR